MFGLSGTELLLVGLFAFIVFGPDKMPEIVRTVSKAINQFKRTQEDMERLVRAEMMGAMGDEKQEPSVGTRLQQAGSGPAEPTLEEPTVASSLYGTAQNEQEDEE